MVVLHCLVEEGCIILFSGLHLGIFIGGACGYLAVYLVAELIIYFCRSVVRHIDLQILTATKVQSL